MIWMSRFVCRKVWLPCITFKLTGRKKAEEGYCKSGISQSYQEVSGEFTEATCTSYCPGWTCCVYSSGRSGWRCKKRRGHVSVATRAWQRKVIVRSNCFYCSAWRSSRSVLNISIFFVKILHVLLFNICILNQARQGCRWRVDMGT